MFKNLHQKKEWYGYAQALCLGLGGLILTVALVTTVQLLLLVNTSAESDFLFWETPDDYTLRWMTAITIVALFPIAILFFMVAGSYRTPMHQIEHDAMLRDISQATEMLLKQQLKGYYKDIAAQIRVTRMVREIEGDMPKISREAAEIAALVSVMTADNLEQVQSEVEYAAHSVAAAEQKSAELLHKLSDIQKTVDDLDKRSQGVRDDTIGIHETISQLQHTLAAIRARATVQQDTIPSKVTPIKL